MSKTGAWHCRRTDRDSVYRGRRGTTGANRRSRMLRRILLGETPASISGRQYALRLAQGPKAGVAGLIGIDLPYLEAPMPGRVGASAYATHLHPTIEAFRSCLSMQAANWFRKEL